MQRELSSTCGDVFPGGREVASVLRRTARLIWWEACVLHTGATKPRERTAALHWRANKADGNGRMHAACVHHAFMCASARLPPWRTSPAAAVSGIGLIAESPRHTRTGRTHGQQEFMQPQHSSRQSQYGGCSKTMEGPKLLPPQSLHFFLWLTWNPVNTSNALDRAGRERTESPWGCADRFSNPVKSDSSGLA